MPNDNNQTKNASRPERRDPYAPKNRRQTSQEHEEEDNAIDQRVQPNLKKRNVKYRRTNSTIETLGKNAQIGAKSAANGIASWFGVVDQESMGHMQHQYVTHKTTMLKGSAPVMGIARPGRRVPRANMQSDPKMLRLAMEMANASSSSDEGDEQQIVVNSKHFTRDLNEGLSHYHKIRDMERKREVKPGWFGGEVNVRRDSIKGYRSLNPSAPKRRRHSHIRDNTMVKLQLIQMREFYPYFIYVLTAIQALIAVAMGFHAYTTSDFAPWGLATVVQQCVLSGDAADICPLDFAQQKTIINKTVVNNWSFGPKNQYLLDYGAKFAPCMRQETGMQLQAAKQRQDECIYQASVDSDVGYMCDESLFNSSSTNIGMACCRLPTSGRAGMTKYPDCVQAHTDAGEAMSATSWIQGVECDYNTDYIVLRPCCSALDETCELLTEEQCEYKEGKWHSDKQLCADTMCLTENCKFFSRFDGDNLEADSTFRNQPAQPNQWYRFILPLFIHGGAAHVVLALLVQIYIGKTVERQAGAIRTFLIYFISGIGGNLISGIFSPLTVSMGADPAIYGLLGVQIVDLFQSWQIVPKPLRVLLKLTLIIAISLLIGTFPYVDNWSHIGGFVFGVVSAVVFLPFITFGRWDARRKRILLAICVPLLFILILLAVLTFYLIQNTDFCPWCRHLNCVPYVAEIDCSLQA